MLATEETVENTGSFKENSPSLHWPLFCHKGCRAAQSEIKPPHITMFNQLYYFAWVKPQVILPKIRNVILIHEVLGCPTVFSHFL